MDYPAADDHKTKKELIKELSAMRKRVAELAQAETEFKATQKTLRQTEQTLQVLINATQETLLVLDKDGTVLLANEEIARRLGKTVAEITGSCIFNHFPEEVAKLRREELDYVFATGTPTHFEDNRERGFYGVYSYPILDGNKNVSSVVIFAQEITIQKQAEEALRKSEIKYRTMFENSLEGIYQISPEGHFLSANPAIANMLGYESPGELITAIADVGTQIVAYPEDREEALKSINEQGFLKNFEIRCHRKDRSIIWVSFSTRPVQDEQGNVFCYEGTCQDVTERKRMEAILKDSEERFRILVEHLPQSIFLKDRFSNYITCNRCYARDLDIDPAAIVGKTDYELHPKELAKKYRADDQKTIATGKITHLQEKFIRFGEERWSWTIKVPYRDAHGDIIGVLGISEDITERVRSEEALRESEARFRRIIENSRDLIYRTSLPDGKFEYLSHAAIAISGHRLEDQLDARTVFKRIIHPDWQHYFRKRWKKLLQGKVPPYNEYKIIHKSGAERWLYQRDVVITNDNGHPIAVEGIVTDITERKNIEEELKKHRDKLEDLVKERTDALEDKSRTLEELNTALKVLLRQREQDKSELEERLVSNVKTLIMPYLEKIMNTTMNLQQRSLLTVLESNLNEVVSPFLRNLQQFNLTPRENQVAGLIKGGKTTKEIAEVIGVAPSSIEAYRKSIRDKLKLTNRKINLRTYLQVLQ